MRRAFEYLGNDLMQGKTMWVRKSHKGIRALPESFWTMDVRCSKASRQAEPEADKIAGLQQWEVLLCYELAA